MKSKETAKIGLREKSREKVGKILNHVLADEVHLSLATKDYHWNVTGSNFHGLHHLFEEHYEALDKHIDAVAERARAIGVRAEGSWAELTHSARLDAPPGAGMPGMRMVAAALKLHEELIVHLRGDIEACTERYDDAGTADFITGLMEFHETSAWMLRALLEKRD